MKVDLRKKPYNLNNEQISWVNETLKSMDLISKVKQLFTCLTASNDPGYLNMVSSEFTPGGIRFNPMNPADTLNHNKTLQESSKIPYLIAANTEAGGNGACKGGTEIGFGTKIGSTQDLNLAYQMGYVSAKEAKACGINTLFAPIVDIHHDFHNPIVAYKCFSSDPKLVKDMSLEFLKGVKDNNLIACAKHFPGDGYDERDQHLSPSMNPLSVNEWDDSFGLVYKSLIDEGLPMIMAGHISLPSYEKHFNKDAEILPASISYELITKLLKEKLEFNGVVTTDATHMVGLTSSMKRSEFLPKIIESGCDMILFYNDFNEDLDYMLKAIEDDRLSTERIDDAVTRILGLKAKIGLNDKNNLSFNEESLKDIGTVEAKKVAKEASKKSITLVKEEPGVLPMTSEKYKKVLIVPHNDENPFESLMPKGIPTIYDYIKEKLEEKGFEVEIFESLMDKAKKASPMEAFKIISNIYNNKTPITNLTDNYSIIIHVLDFDSRNTTSRVVWQMSKGTPDIPWYTHEIPTLAVSLRNPFHLFDLPQVKTYINCYDKQKITIDSLVDKLTGNEEFMGVSSVDCFCDDKLSKLL